ncbi:MAG: hypothetical protein WBD20_09115 [Pirellulaceae bacterium]
MTSSSQLKQHPINQIITQGAIYLSPGGQIVQDRSQKRNPR